MKNTSIKSLSVAAALMGAVGMAAALAPVEAIANNVLHLLEKGADPAFIGGVVAGERESDLEEWESDGSSL